LFRSTQDTLPIGAGATHWERQKALLCFAAAFLLLGHWQRILWALANISLSQVSTIAAAACISTALCIHVSAHMKGWTLRVQDTWYQVWSQCLGSHLHQ
jgi:hypothetical protein